LQGSTRFLDSLWQCRGRLGCHQWAEAMLHRQLGRGADICVATSLIASTAQARLGGNAPYFCVILARVVVPQAQFVLARMNKRSRVTRLAGLESKALHKIVSSAGLRRRRRPAKRKFFGACCPKPR